MSIGSYLGNMFGGAAPIAGAPGQPIGTTPLPYDLQLEQIKRQQALADALKAQTNEPIPIQSYNGTQAPIPWTAVLAKALQGAESGLTARAADKRLQGLGAQSAADMQDTLNVAMGGTAGAGAGGGAAPAGPSAPMATPPPAGPPPSTMPSPAGPMPGGMMPPNPSGPTPSGAPTGAMPMPQAGPPPAGMPPQGAPAPAGAPPGAMPAPGGPTPDAGAPTPGGAAGASPLIPPEAAKLMMMQGGSPAAQALRQMLVTQLVARSHAQASLSQFDLTQLPPKVVTAAKAMVANGKDPVEMIMAQTKGTVSGGNAWENGPNGWHITARGNPTTTIQPADYAKYNIDPRALAPNTIPQIDANNNITFKKGGDASSQARYGQEVNLAQTKANIGVAAAAARPPRSAIGYIMQPWMKANPNATPDQIAQAESGYMGQMAMGKNMAAGKIGETITNVKNAAGHLNVLKQLASAMDNGDVQAYNSLKNAFKAQFGADLPVQMKAAIPIIAGEVVKATVGGGGGGVEDRNVMRDALNNSLADHQMTAVIDTQRALMLKQYATRKDNYQRQGFTDWNKRYADPGIEREIAANPDLAGPGGGAPAAGGISAQDAAAELARRKAARGGR